MIEGWTWHSVVGISAKFSVTMHLYLIRERAFALDKREMAPMARMRDGSPLIIGADSYVNSRRVYRCVLHLFALV